MVDKQKDLHDLIATFIDNEAGIDNKEEVEEDKEEEEEGNDEIFLHFVDDTLEAGSLLPKYLPLASMTSNIVEVNDINAMVEQAKKQARTGPSPVKHSLVEHPILENILVLNEFPHRTGMDYSNYVLYWISVRVLLPDKQQQNWIFQSILSKTALKHCKLNYVPNDKMDTVFNYLCHKKEKRLELSIGD
ncbi:uncharacterized protein FOMMEDRAFT_24964 [Fomitiporia mediterranea MF3/22]|uniref:uncharacterized protein n=1 Tax=Fomitiporia mediterranea (strain MF3/22) TaxID=694068 RepID=UPI0004408447|nr:uncharacterized protein FOMMEDRAFT_24964 [Fomitiporia mediterranea MF3/22]EJD07647.1 hypothetical protein FOMMEDRAFT_24964 [Fomitiporia mediterranea MF3/22]